MAKAEGIPPTASVASVGPGLRYVGNWAYAYSGDLVTDSNNELTMLEFTTGMGIIVAKIQFNDLSGSADLFTYKIYLNDVLMNAYNATAFSTEQNNPDPVLFMIIPPFTKVKCAAKNSAANNRNVIVAFTGRVYDV